MPKVNYVDEIPVKHNCLWKYAIVHTFRFFVWNVNFELDVTYVSKNRSEGSRFIPLLKFPTPISTIETFGDGVSRYWPYVFKFECLFYFVIVKLTRQQAKNMMDQYFQRIKKLSENTALPSRVRFRLLDIIDMRQREWRQRRQVAGPRPVSEIRAEFGNDLGKAYIGLSARTFFELFLGHLRKKNFMEDIIFAGKQNLK